MNIRFVTMVLLLIIIGSFLVIKNQLSLNTDASFLPDQAPVSELSTAQVKDEGKIHYLFDLVDHTPEQIKHLLERAEILSKAGNATDEKSRIAMVIHGPDVEIFNKKNYSKNKDIIDLAARLDASDIIDFKVCQVTADSRGIKESSFPSFMEMVPFAPDEIDRLENEGFVEF